MDVFAAAKAFFRRAFKTQGRLPRAITLDGYQASHRVARESLGEHRHGKRIKLRSSKYLNNLIEQDHRSVKLRLGPMLGFKRFRNASLRSPASNLCIASGKVSSTSASFAPITKPRRRFGMRFLRHDSGSASMPLPRTYPEFGPESFRSAAATLAGVEVMHMIRKGQMRARGTLRPVQQFYALAA